MSPILLGWPGSEDSIWPCYWQVCLPTALVILITVPGYVVMQEEYNKGVVLFYASSYPGSVPGRNEAVAVPDDIPVQEGQRPEG